MKLISLVFSFRNEEKTLKSWLKELSKISTKNKHQDMSLFLLMILQKTIPKNINRSSEIIPN